MAIKPITPKEAKVLKIDFIPEAVIKSFNNLIAKNLDLSGKSIFTQNEVVKEIIRLDENITRDAIINNRWLDIEEIYRKEGWKVSYESPAIGESFEAHFTFKE